MMDITCWYEHGYVQELKRNFDLLIVDARGHGLSGKPHDPTDYEDKTMARDVLAVMDDAGVKTSSFFGFSMGGRTGLELAYIAPHRFSFFVIASATPGPRTKESSRRCIVRTEFHTIPDLKHMHTFGRTDLIFPIVKKFLERNK